jgi:hypothetical protein
MAEKRPPIKIRLKINKLTGEIEELIVDDQARMAPEEYHDQVARLVARALGKQADVLDTALEERETEAPGRADPGRAKEREQEEGKEGGGR